MCMSDDRSSLRIEILGLSSGVRVGVINGSSAVGLTSVEGSFICIVESMPSVL